VNTSNNTSNSDAQEERRFALLLHAGYGKCFVTARRHEGTFQALPGIGSYGSLPDLPADSVAVSECGMDSRWQGERILEVRDEIPLETTLLRKR
jgi:hypothetical protein